MCPAALSPPSDAVAEESGRWEFAGAREVIHPASRDGRGNWCADGNLQAQERLFIPLRGMADALWFSTHHEKFCCSIGIAIVGWILIHRNNRSLHRLPWLLPIRGGTSSTLQLCGMADALGMPRLFA
jgi:hypothetical protein